MTSYRCTADGGARDILAGAIVRVSWESIAPLWGAEIREHLLVTVFATASITVIVTSYVLVAPTCRIAAMQGSGTMPFEPCSVDTTT